MTEQDDILRYRIQEHSDKLEKIEGLMATATTELARIATLVDQSVAQTTDNKRTLKSIFASIIIGVTMLFITAIVAKLT